MVFQPRDQRTEWDCDGIVRKFSEYEHGYQLVLVNIIRERVRRWRALGVSRRHAHDARPPARTHPLTIPQDAIA